jgi:hypothetical protein
VQFVHVVVVRIGDPRQIADEVVVNHGSSPLLSRCV